MIENVYGQLKDFAMGHGYDLEIYDLHWGVPDLITDDHSLLDTCIKTLNKCMESTPGFSVVVI